jgi:hypothetical protein
MNVRLHVQHGEPTTSSEIYILLLQADDSRQQIETVFAQKQMFDLV